MVFRGGADSPSLQRKIFHMNSITLWIAWGNLLSAGITLMQHSQPQLPALLRTLVLCEHRCVMFVDCRYRMITSKPRGCISAIQRESNSQPEWYNDFPETCLLSKFVLPLCCYYGKKLLQNVCLQFWYTLAKCKSVLLWCNMKILVIKSKLYGMPLIETFFERDYYVCRVHCSML